MDIKDIQRIQRIEDRLEEIEANMQPIRTIHWYPGPEHVKKPKQAAATKKGGIENG